MNAPVLSRRASDRFLGFVESKLTAAGIAKTIPAKERLDEAYRLFARGERIRSVVEEAIESHDGEDEIGVPGDLESQVRGYLVENPEAPWENAVASALDREVS